jgi:hypothetical protein
VYKPSPRAGKAPSREASRTAAMFLCIVNGIYSMNKEYLSQLVILTESVHSEMNNSTQVLDIVAFTKIREHSSIDANSKGGLKLLAFDRDLLRRAKPVLRGKSPPIIISLNP